MLNNLTSSSGRKTGVVLAIALSLSIGWGIRGNFGHEYGAMIAGALAAMAACLLSGREDWRRRFPYFAFFGALGWGFGGSMSYMVVIAYTHSGHWPSQLYGFAALFVLGFLWASLGGAATAFPAVARLQQVRDLFRPLLWVLTAWILLDLLEPSLEARLKGIADMRRHESLLYWFDSDWLPALIALAALLLFDLWDRRFEKLHLLIIFAAAGALLGFGAQKLFDAIGLSPRLAELLVRYEGDAEMWKREELLNNWPPFFRLISGHLGWISGLLAGLGAFFFKHGKFRFGSSLLLHMAIGWWAGFLLFPVLLGIRMTPPRGDSWAGILGVFGGATIYFVRHDLKAVAWASLQNGLIGGLGFSGAAFLKLLLVAPGNAALSAGSTVPLAWAHWQNANWHSFLEQSYGFINGLGIALAMLGLARREKPLADGETPSGWREVVSIGFVLLALTYVNLYKNVKQWIQARVVPESMRAPLFESIGLPAHAWFNLLYALTAAGAILLMAIHLRRRLAVVPATWLGKGQLIYVFFLWCMVIGNFERALAGFNEQRLLTEGVIFANAVLVTVLALALPALQKPALAAPQATAGSRLWNLAALNLAALLLAAGFETAITRAIYGDKHAGHSGKQTRFGPEATWKTQPLRKGKDHL